VRASLKEWQGKDGQPQHGISIVVESVMSEYQFEARRKSAAAAPAEA
jgi:single-stranded DNA-binding protein